MMIQLGDLPKYCFLQHSNRREHCPIGICFLIKRQRVSPWRWRHSVEPIAASANWKWAERANLRFGAVVTFYDGISGFFARSYNGVAIGNLAQQNCQIGRLNYFKKFVRCVVLQPPHSRCCIENGNSCFGAESHNCFIIKSSLVGNHKPVLIAKEDQAQYAPHVVLKIRVEEIHWPTRFRWRKTAKHQHFSRWRQKRFQRMALDVLHNKWYVNKKNISANTCHIGICGNDCSIEKKLKNQVTMQFNKYESCWLRHPAWM